jgi:hypothetical protein
MSGPSNIAFQFLTEYACFIVPRAKKHCFILVLLAPVVLTLACTERWTGWTHTCHSPDDEAAEMSLELDPPTTEERTGAWTVRRGIVSSISNVTGTVHLRFHARLSTDGGHDVEMVHVQPGMMEGSVTTVPSGDACGLRMVRSWGAP